MNVNPVVKTVLAMALFVLGCERADAEQPVEVFLDGGAAGRGGASSDTVPSAGGAVAVVTGTAPQLLETHSGYGIPTCFDCHGASAPYPHVAQAYGPPDCVSCHGYNGAVHRDHAVPENPGCADCHQSVPHVSAFAVPKDCITCHHQS